jgi:LPS-assembly protein
LKGLKTLSLFLVCFLLILLKINSLYALPASLKIEVSADRFEILGRGEKLLAEGNVFIESKDFFILADQAIFDPRREILVLKRFQIQDLTENASLRGDSATVDLRFNQLESDSVLLFLKKQNIRIKAYGFEKNALNEYKAERAIITTCELDCEKEEFPPWSIEVKNFIFGPDELSKSDASKFRAGRFPLLYLPKSILMPKVSLPVLQERKQGFLLPNIAQGNRLGFGFQLPYFLPLTDQIDFTVSPLYLTKRGLLFDLENRITLTENIKSVFNYRYLEDREKGEGNRWWLTGKVDVGLRENLDVHLDVDLTSDKVFLEEFNVGEGGFDRVKSRYLETFRRDVDDKTQDYRASSLWGQWFRGSLYSRISSTYYDYHGPNDEKTILQPLANFHLNILPFEWHALLPTFVFDYYYFYRERDYYGHRVSPKLELNYPFKFSYLRNLFTLSYTQNLYYLSGRGNFSQDNLSIGFVSAEVSTYTLLKRSYFLPFGGRGDLSFEHVLKPFAILHYQSKPSRKDVPIFVDEDLLKDKTLALEYGLWQFFNLPTRYNFLIIKAYQIYDIEKAKKSATSLPPEERALSDLYLQILLQGRRISARYDATYNFYGYGFKKHYFTVTTNKVLIDRINLQYQEDSAWKIRQVVFEAYHAFWQKLALHFYATRNLKLNQTSELKLELAYLHDCYLLGFGFTSTPKDTKFHFMVNLVGLGGLGTSSLAQNYP